MPPYAKADGFQVREREPFNGGPPLARLGSADLTPLEHFFVRSHGRVPRVQVEEWRLEVGGLVEEPLRLSLKEVRTRFAKLRMAATLSCAGNRRAELLEVAPVPREIAWGAEAISNAMWGGARLRDVLEEAGVKGAARHVKLEGMDRVRVPGGTSPFGCSVPLAKALSGEVLLAYEMNGKPLAAVHGFPLRGVVPGYIGARSVKWLGRVEVAARPSQNHFQAVSYKKVRAGASKRAVRRSPPLQDAPVNSVICEPGEGSRVRAGRVTARGYAVSGGGRRIARVEVSGDGGRTWSPARLLGRPTPWAWRLWQANLSVEGGPTVLAVRAFDSGGRGQPASLRRAWNALGYVNNAWHRVRVTAV